MNILITCGPSFEPIDEARRLTNFSTGALGITLANHFVEMGHQVLCLKGTGSTSCTPCQAQKIQTFSTNDHLIDLLQKAAANEKVDAILHAAALCDYRVDQVLNDSGESLHSPKISTRDGRLHLILSPATKVLPQLRAWFPAARIVGWKYELAGTRDEAFSKAWRQLAECRTDACVLNGKAYGPGFGICKKNRAIEECDTPQALCRALENFLQNPDYS